MLKIVIPDVVYITDDSLLQFQFLFIIFFTEIINGIFVGKRTIKLNCIAHCYANYSR